MENLEILKVELKKLDEQIKDKKEDVDMLKQFAYDNCEDIENVVRTYNSGQMNEYDYKEKVIELKINAAKKRREIKKIEHTLEIMENESLLVSNEITNVTVESTSGVRYGNNKIRFSKEIEKETKMLLTDFTADSMAILALELEKIAILETNGKIYTTHKTELAFKASKKIDEEILVVTKETEEMKKFGKKIDAKEKSLAKFPSKANESSR